MILHSIKACLSRLARKRFAKWPFRKARYPVRILLSEDQRHRPRCLNSIVRQAGYTNGDRLIVMLESDFQRIADLAHKKIDSPVEALVWRQIEHARLTRLTQLS